MELWKNIPGYEGIYQASTLGLIRTAPDKVTYTEKHGIRHWKSRILKTRGKQNSGYRVTLWKEGESKDFLTARLVAMTFVDGYQKDLTVNHKNGDRFDNRIENLEWLSLADNIRHGFKTGLYFAQQKVVVYDRNKKAAIEFRSMSEASAYLGFNKGYISNLLNKSKGESHADSN